MLPFVCVCMCACVLTPPVFSRSVPCVCAQTRVRVCLHALAHTRICACLCGYFCVCVRARIHPQCSVTVCARASVHVQYVCVRTFVCTARKHPQSSSPHHARRLVTGCGCGVSRGSVGNKSSGSSRSGSGSQQQSIQLGAKTDESATQRQREVNKKSP